MMALLDKFWIVHGGVQGVANRDIKLENTLLDGSPRPLVKICDFGYSKVCFCAIIISHTPTRPSLVEKGRP